MSNNIKNLKIGSTIVLKSSGFGQTRITKTKITGETKTCWRVGKTLYRKDNGWTRGESYYGSYIEEYDPKKHDESLKEALRKKYIEWAENMEWKKYSLEQMKSIYEFLAKI